MPYAFYIADQELVEQIGSYLEKNKGDIFVNSHHFEFFISRIQHYLDLAIDIDMKRLILFLLIFG